MDGEDIIKVFGSYDSVDCLYDYIEETTISEKTYNKLISWDYYAKRYGNDIRAYSCWLIYPPAQPAGDIP